MLPSSVLGEYCHLCTLNSTHPLLPQKGEQVGEKPQLIYTARNSWKVCITSVSHFFPPQEVRGKQGREEGWKVLEVHMNSMFCSMF